MFELLIAALLFATTARYAGENGLQRFKDLPENKAKGVHESFASRTFDWLILLNLAVSLVNGGLALYLGSWVGVAISCAALVLTSVARAMRPAARANVNDGFAQRGLEPLMQRETSARGYRRQKQFATAALLGYLSVRVLNALADETGETWPQLLLVPALILAFGGGLALLWSVAWRFGDERPAR
jgi:hypothetical protein